MDLYVGAVDEVPSRSELRPELTPQFQKNLR
jgi:hypothetical protein